MNTKNLDEEQRKCFVRDIKRGKSAKIDPSAWQTDTCIGEWHYSRYTFQHHNYKKSANVASKPYIAEDIRFTSSKDGKTLYAILLA